MKDFAKSIHVGNEKAISSTFHINDYGVEVGQWSWDWRGKAPDENKQKEIERKIKSYVQQINKNVPAGDSDERDEVYSKLDKFVRAQGLNKKTGNSKVGNTDILSGNYIILSDDGHVWFRDEHEYVSLKNLDAWAQKRIASYQSSIDEIKKGVAEAKQAAKKAGLI